MEARLQPEQSNNWVFVEHPEKHTEMYFYFRPKANDTKLERYKRLLLQ